MPFDLGSVNPWRDEDYWPREDAEIGSERWIAAEIAAGRSGEEIDKLGRGRAPAAAVRRETGRTRSGCGGSNYGECTRLLPLTPLLIWATFFVLLALNVHV